MRRFFLTSAIVSALAAPLGGSIAAQVTINTGTPAEYVGPLGKDSNFGPIPTAIAQTFFAPAGTSFLQSFSFFFTNFINGGALLLDASVYQFDGDHLTGPALFTSATVHGTDSFGDEMVTFGSQVAPLKVFASPGTMYALVLSAVNSYALTPDGSSVLVGGTATDAYPNGDLFVSTAIDAPSLSAPGGFFAAGDPADAAFSATFTTTAVTPTPEPTSVTLVVLGLAGVGGAGLRRRTSRRRVQDALRS
jgi:MYXO-CTERM domain-containing protein